jgi:hypothetical protein
MSVTIVNGSGLTALAHGIATAEAGINISKFEFTVKPEWKKFLQSRTDEKIAFATAPAELNLSVEGEITLATGLMAATFATAVTIAGSVALFGAPSTGIYLDQATVSRPRDGWNTFAGEFSSNAGIT